jgi:purine-binding chemotaxis protein CheW
MRLLLFTIDDRRFALPAGDVSEIIRAVAITTLPGAPSVVEGIIDLRGEVVPVFDLRRRFGVPTRDVELSDQFIIARTPRRIAALHVDRAIDIVDADAPAGNAGGTELHPAIAGVATLGDGLALISDVDAFLSHAEAESLESALAAAR